MGLTNEDPARFAADRTGHDGFCVFVRHDTKAVIQVMCECGWEGTETRSRTAALDEHAMHQRKPARPPAAATAAVIRFETEPFDPTEVRTDQGWVAVPVTPGPVQGSLL